MVHSHVNCVWTQAWAFTIPLYIHTYYAHTVLYLVVSMDIDGWLFVCASDGWHIPRWQLKVGDTLAKGQYGGE